MRSDWYESGFQTRQHPHDIPQVICPRDSQALNGLLGHVSPGDHGPGKAHFGGFAQALLPIRHRPDLTGETNLTENHQIPGQSPVANARDSGQQSRQICRGLHDPYPAHHVDKNIVGMGGYTPMTVECGQQQRESVRLKPDSHAPGRAAAALISQSLNFHQRGRLP